jgi:transcriptional regulator with XRE-family HTH domain
VHSVTNLNDIYSHRMEGFSDRMRDRFAHMRDLHGMTQAELAEKIGVSAASVGHYLSGTRVPRGPVVGRLAKALGVSLNGCPTAWRRLRRLTSGIWM